MPRTLASVTALCVPVALAGCGAPSGSSPDAPGRAITVELLPVRDTGVRGEARLVQGVGEVRVTARLEGLRPRWSYTLFLAERGDCGGTEPGGARTVPLAGALRTVSIELPRLVSDDAGKMEITLGVGGTLRGAGSDFAGRALVLQPDGYGRAACGGVPAA